MVLEPLDIVEHEHLHPRSRVTDRAEVVERELLGRDFDGLFTPDDAAIFGGAYDESLTSLPEPASE